MKTLALAIALVALVGCAKLNSTVDGSDERPDWLRDPARGEYPHNPRGW